MMIMLNQVPHWLIDKLKTDDIAVKGNILQSKTLAKSSAPWSFNQEWQAFEQNKMSRTWNLTAEQRLQQFFIETDSSKDDLQHLNVLDAGCGNGLLSQIIAENGARVLAVDLHQMLPSIAKKITPNEDNLCFLHADINDLPIYPNTFDLIISNGVLHHTPNTQMAFEQLAKRVKSGGKLYVWLYKKPLTFKGKLLLFMADVLRSVISRLSPKLQHLAAKSITYFFYWVSKIRKGQNSTKDFNDLLIEIYDTFTPAYRHYHYPLEVASWFAEAGFNNAVISHWNNSYGFGMYAVKR